MFVELHILQNFALSNLNRDDTGAPKSCIFAGSRRARISSQCLKRAVRTVIREDELVPSEQLAYRTKKIVDLLAKRLVAHGVEAELANLVASNAMEGIKFTLKKDKTEYLLMVGEREVVQIAEICKANMDKLNMPRVNTKDDKKKSKEIDKGLGKELLAVLDGGDAVDLALFGRMIATHPDKNIDAAVQMAHAFSTNVVANEFDFYSAVDDLQEDTDDSGAGAAMLGTILYNSSCYYRYANLDLKQLMSNLHGDERLTLDALKAFLEGMVKAVPTGKQSNSAAQNPPAMVLAVVRGSGLWSLANAFTSPVTGWKEDLVNLSAQKMLQHWDQLSKMYGDDGIKYAGYSTYLSLDNTAVGLTTEQNFNILKERVLEEVIQSQ